MSTDFQQFSTLFLLLKAAGQTKKTASYHAISDFLSSPPGGRQMSRRCQVLAVGVGAWIDSVRHQGLAALTDRQAAGTAPLVVTVTVIGTRTPRNRPQVLYPRWTVVKQQASLAYKVEAVFGVVPQPVEA